MRFPDQGNYIRIRVGGGGRKSGAIGLLMLNKFPLFPFTEDGKSRNVLFVAFCRDLFYCPKKDVKNTAGRSQKISGLRDESRNKGNNRIFGPTPT